ncbi:peroxiredoxin-like family 1 protein [Syntrophotalea carbinolica DSM 2380]|uniref:Peroxiredoxin-like family 1 protein n=1 Tax=Syntrophotalea carbinolica (strain DSM 2380 / NBRC 103641 / GraBd1) TaxID=338963 RepID=Q3A3C7_SYNC1|nr:thioredoxin family protein [Syntrophotalea carbinolica]ABA89130.1 peroxiredoxin-like family 1 protein [Syntrophotalea carbinolica DSM 2380]
MSLVYSQDMPIGSAMPAFRLKDPYGHLFGSDELFGRKGLLVVFSCNHCPYANAQWPRLVALAAEFKSRGIACVAINSNIHPDYPEDAPSAMKRKIAALQIDFPYLVDDTQQVARDFAAQCTPDPYLFDAAGFLVYHGRIDDNWKDEGKVTRHNLRDAMEALVHGAPCLEVQSPSMGCSIKWRH